MGGKYGGKGGGGYGGGGYGGGGGGGSYGLGGEMEEMDVDDRDIGRIVGRGGCNIRDLQERCRHSPGTGSKGCGKNRSAVCTELH
eukprot:Skav218968  [mRNA]  locus=scaffold1532:9719:10241:+ [translate_table: standard]